MRNYGKFREIPLTEITPEGWLRRTLEIQRDGLTGHIEVAGYPYDTYGWGGRKVKARSGGEVEEWWPYEQVAYWLDGAHRCGLLLQDETLLRRTRKQLDYVLRHQGKDGYLGPKHLRPPKFQYRWSHGVFFRALQAEYHATKNPAILRALREHYLSGTCDHSGHRCMVNIETVLWTYLHTGDQNLFEHALHAWDTFNAINADKANSLKNLLSSKFVDEHGVTYIEEAKIPTILYMATGAKTLLKAGRNSFRKLDRMHMLISGVHSSAEHLHDQTEQDCHETCDIVDYGWSAGYLLMATGEAGYADRIERALFNAGFGAVKSDFKALQYFSCPNQAVLGPNNDVSRMTRGGSWMSYAPKPGTECCTGEINRLVPNYIARMYMTDETGGLVAATYGPSRVTRQLGARGQEVTLVQETDYPFGERIDFEVRVDSPVKFSLYLRIPGWCRKAELRINGKRHTGKCKPGTFVQLDREWRHNDRISLRLPMETKLVHWKTGGVALERGPLVYSVKIDEQWTPNPEKKFQTKEFPAWKTKPKSDWNYAIATDGRSVGTEVQVVHHEMTPEPWSPESAPIELRVPARKVTGWKLLKRKQVCRGNKQGEGRTVRGNFLITPSLPAETTLKTKLGKTIQTISMIPMGCTHLRMTILPKGK
jgi:hypothetical protein